MKTAYFKNMNKMLNFIALHEVIAIFAKGDYVCVVYKASEDSPNA